MSTSQHHTSWVIRCSFTSGVLLLTFMFIGFSESLESAGNHTKPVSKNCSLEKTSCTNCTSYSNCGWCFAQSFCTEKTLEKRGVCDEDDWDYGDCEKKEKEAVLLYVLLACAVLLLLVVVLLVLYIFFCKLPRDKYAPLNTKDIQKRRNRTPLMSKKFKPAGSRTDELKKKYGFQ